jgi:predicted phage terminase large subunit-like protein
MRQQQRQQRPSSPQSQQVTTRDLARLTPAGLAREMAPYPYLLGRHLNLLNLQLLHLAAGRTRRLMVTMPPRHGKSELCSLYFPAWLLGNFPEREVILCSYEADFAAGWGRRVRDTLIECRERGLFGVAPRGDVKAANRWQLAGHRGGMATAGAGGAITGKGADLLVIDDPFKNAEDANSPTIREKVWDWWQSTASTRLSPTGVVLLVNTRWHLDDLSGRLLEREPERWHLVNFPAVAEDADALGRQPGEALWPERYNLQALQQIERSVGSYWWQSLYQQRPVTRGGGFFKRSWFEIVDAPPAEVTARVRYWDKAATADGGDWTVGVLLSRTAEGLYYVEDVVRAQESSGGVERIVLATAAADAERYGNSVRIGMEQEPGSSGKDMAVSYARKLSGYPFRAVRSTGSKEIRADPFAAQCEAGNVRLVRGQWNAAYVEELCAFPRSAHDDQVDGSSGAFGMLSKGGGMKFL